MGPIYDPSGQPAYGLTHMGPMWNLVAPYGAVAEGVGLNLTVRNPEDRFSCVTAHITYQLFKVKTGPFHINKICRCRLPIL